MLFHTPRQMIRWIWSLHEIQAMNYRPIVFESDFKRGKNQFVATLSSFFLFKYTKGMKLMQLVEGENGNEEENW